MSATKAFRRGVLALAVAVTTVSCALDEDITAPAPSKGELQAVLTGAAADALDASGRFILTAPPETGAEITAVQATALAVAWAKQFGPLLRSMLEGERGGPITMNRLVACGRAMYALPAFDEPQADANPALRNFLSAQWLVTLCEGAVPKLSVAVAASATELVILDDGRIRFPANAGNEFYPHGIPVGHAGEFPVSPERAAWSVAQQTGRRINTAPSLISGVGRHAGHARWAWGLDSPSTVRTASDRSVIVPTMFLSERLPGTSIEAMYVPAVTQPDWIELTSYPVGVVGESAESYEARVRNETRKILVSRLPDIPVSFERVVSVEDKP